MSEVPAVPPSDAPIPAFDAVETHDGLVAWSRAYCERTVAATDLDVALDRVTWEVSTRAKRRAAAVIHPQLADAELGTPVDWASRDDTPSNRSGEARPAGDAADGPPACTVRLTRDAARAYDRADWTATLRHELVHVEQFQRYGTTGHGSRFEARAADLETTVRCERFATPRYVLTCPDCEAVVARRYRDCELVRRHEAYRSGCCEAPLVLTETGASG